MVVRLAVVIENCVLLRLGSRFLSHDATTSNVRQDNTRKAKTDKYMQHEILGFQNIFLTQQKE